MTDFDKLIREKAEQAHYDFNPSDWKKFKGKTGKSNHWFYATAGGIAIVAAVISSILFLGKKTETESRAKDADTATTTTVETHDTQEETTIKAPEIQKASETQRITHNNIATHTDSTSQQSENAMSQQPAKHVSDKKDYDRNVLGRPLVIDVDTIKDNVPSDEELKKANSGLFQ